MIIKKIFEKKKDGTFKDMLSESKWMYKYARQFWGIMILYIILGIMSTFMGLACSVSSRYAIDLVISLMQHKSITVPGQLYFYIAVMVIMALGGVLIAAFANRISTKATLEVNKRIQTDAYDKIMNTEWEYISDYHSGDLINRFNNDISTISGNVINWIPTFITTAVQFVSILIVIVLYDWTMAVFALMAAPITLAVSRILTGKMRKYNRKMREMSSNMMSFHQESFVNIQQIKAFDLINPFKSRLGNVQNEYIKMSLDYNRFSIMTSSFMSAVGMFVTYLCLGWGMFRLFYGFISYGTVILFLQLSSSLSSSFSAMVAMIPAAIAATTSAGRVMELFDMPDEKNECTAAQNINDKADKLNISGGLSVSFNNVNFKYRKGNIVLSDANIEAKPNEVIGLIGASGGGKTTTIRIILGLLHPQSGECVITDKEGISVSAAPQTRCFMSYVPQSNTIFSGTIAENMRMVKPDATDEEINNVLKLACAYDFIIKLPEGIYSHIGEKGIGFSEGQNQRLSIARALLRNAPILILDEATSALDDTTAAKVLNNIMTSYQNRTCILTTHRPGVASMCNRVYQICDGMVIQKDNLSEE
ncbi:MAG: ABC transporter ATP-binding protein [Eubacterium sp.]